MFDGLLAPHIFTVMASYRDEAITGGGSVLIWQTNHSLSFKKKIIIIPAILFKAKLMSDFPRRDGKEQDFIE